jgi:glycosyl transferase family 11
MIGVRLQGGLGNQLFQYAAGLRLALRHRTALTLDLRGLADSGAETRRRFELDAFAIEARRAGRLPRSAVGRWVSRARRRIAELRAAPPPLGLQPMVERGYAFDPALLDAPDDVYLRGYWQSEKYFTDVEPAVRAHLRIVPPPAPEIEAWARRLSRVEAVAVHVRRGDYVTNAMHQRFHGVLPADYYRAAVAEMIRRVPRAELFVFSDDAAWCESSLALPCPFTVMDGAARPGYEDLRLMSRCRHHVIANSTFSWWGAWLARAPGGIVMAPRRWFLDATMDTRDLTPASWILR